MFVCAVVLTLHVYLKLVQHQLSMLGYRRCIQFLEPEASHVVAVSC